MTPIEQVMQKTKSFKKKHNSLPSFIDEYNKILERLSEKAKHIPQFNLDVFLKKADQVLACKEHKAASALNEVEDYINISAFYYEENFEKKMFLECFIDRFKLEFKKNSTLFADNLLREFSKIIFQDLFVYMEIKTPINHLAVEKHVRQVKEIYGSINYNIIKAKQAKKIAEKYALSFQVILPKCLGYDGGKLQEINQEYNEILDEFCLEIKEKLINQDLEIHLEKIMSFFKDSITEKDFEIADEIDSTVEEFAQKIKSNVDQLYAFTQQVEVYKNNLEILLENLEKYLEEKNLKGIYKSIVIASELEEQLDILNVEKHIQLTRRASIRDQPNLSKALLVNEYISPAIEFYTSLLVDVMRLAEKSNDALELFNSFNEIDTVNFPKLTVQKKILEEIKLKLQGFEPLGELITSWLHSLTEIHGLLLSIESPDKLTTESSRNKRALEEELNKKIQNASAVHRRIIPILNALAENRKPCIAEIRDKINEGKKIEIKTKSKSFYGIGNWHENGRSTLHSQSSNSFFVSSTSASPARLLIENEDLVEQDKIIELKEIAEQYLKLSRSRGDWYDQNQKTKKENYVNNFMKKLNSESLSIEVLKQALIQLKDNNHSLRIQQTGVRRYFNQTCNLLKTGQVSKKKVNFEEAAKIDGELGRFILKAWNLVTDIELRAQKRPRLSANSK